MKKIKKRKFSETEDQVIHQMPLSKKKRKICISQKLSQSEHENESKDQTRIAINISDKELDREPMRTDEADLPVDVPTEGSVQSVSERKKKNKKKRRKSKEESKVKNWPDASNVMENQTMEKDCEKLKTKSRPGFVQNNFCIEPKGSEGDCQIKSYKERPETKKKKREKSTENQTEVASGLELGGQITDEKFKKKKKKKKKLTVESNEKVSHVQTKKSEGTEDSEFVEGIALELGLDRDKKLNSKRENEVESQERHKKHTSKTKQKSKLNWTGDTNLMEKQTVEKEKHKMKRKLKVLIVQDDFCNDTEAKKQSGSENESFKKQTKTKKKKKKKCPENQAEATNLSKDQFPNTENTEKKVKKKKKKSTLANITDLNIEANHLQTKYNKVTTVSEFLPEKKLKPKKDNEDQSPERQDFTEEIRRDSKMTWSKKEGLDLRFDKTRILKKELEQKGVRSAEIPFNPQPLIHKGYESYLGYYKIKSDSALVLEQTKEDHENELKAISGITGIENRRTFFERAIECTLTHYVLHGGNFTEKEADNIIQLAIEVQEIQGKHPLQRKWAYAVKGFRKYASDGSERPSSNCQSNLTTLYSLPVFRTALQRRGFHLNVGPFSENETLQLMKNFTSFLKEKKQPIDNASISDMFSKPGEFYKFYKATKLFLHVGDGLHRNSLQLYLRLRTVYSPNNCKGSYTAAESQIILKRGRELKKKGFYLRWKVIAKEIDRFYRGIDCQYKYLTGGLLRLSKSDMKLLVFSISDITGCALNKIGSLTMLPYKEICESMGMKGTKAAEKLSLFWSKYGMNRYKRSLLPKWSLKDSLELIDSVEAQGEEDEHCVDFESIYEKFKSRVENWEHLREHFNRLRRVVPYYLVRNFHAVMAVGRENILEQIKEKEDEEREKEKHRKGENQTTLDSGKDETEKEEETAESDDEWDEDFFGVTPDSY